MSSDRSSIILDARLVRDYQCRWSSDLGLSCRLSPRANILPQSHHLRPQTLDFCGGPTELDVLSGAVSRFGRQTGVPTPVHDTAAAVLAT